MRTLRIDGTVVAADETTGRVFVVSSTGSVSVLDARSGGVVGTTRVGPFPQYITVDGPAGRVLVSSDKGESVLNARTGALLRTLPYKGNVAVSRDTGRAFMCSFMGTTAPGILRVLDARSLRILRTMRIAQGCDGLAVAGRARRVFVSNSGASSVDVLDARTGVVLRTVPFPYHPGPPVVDERAEHVFVAGGDVVSMLDARTGVVLRTTPVNHGASDIALDTRTGRVFATRPATIDVLDARTGALIHSTNVDTMPASVPVVNAATGHVLVLLTSPMDDRTGQVNGPGTLLALDGSTGAVRRRFRTGPVMSFGLTDVVAADARRTSLRAERERCRHVRRRAPVSGRRRLPLASLALAVMVVCAWVAWPRAANPIVATIEVPLDPGQPVAIALDAATRRAFVASAGLVYMLNLDKNKLVRTIRTGDAMPNPATSPTPALLAVDARAGHVFAANYVNGAVSMLDARSGRLLHTGTATVSPESMEVDEGSGRVFVGSAQDSRIDALDTRTGDEGAISVGIASNGLPGSLAVDDRLHHGFAADRDGGVDMFDTRTGATLHTEGAGHLFTSLAVDARAGRVFAAGDGTRNLSVYDACDGTLVEAVPVGDSPDAIAVDEHTGRAFTSNVGDGTVGIVDTHSLSLLSTVAVGPHPQAVVDERRDCVVILSDTAMSVLDARSGRLVHARPLALIPQAVALDEQTGHILVTVARRTQRPPDAWGWAPRPLRQRLPFVPSRPPARTIPSRIIVLDE